MRLADFVVPEAILPDLRARTEEEAVREMVDALRAAGCVGGADREDLVQAILRREGLGTTGFGPIGVAFPEARHPAVGRTLGTIALSRGGVAFGATGGGVVHTLFLVVSPPDRPADFLRAEEMISWLLRDDDFRDRLRRAGTREEIVRPLAEADRDSPWEADRKAFREQVWARQRQDRPPA
jgi:PTS system fructose-specific IIA component/PTS system nitrogen regulatory IIA component